MKVVEVEQGSIAFYKKTVVDMMIAFEKDLGNKIVDKKKIKDGLDAVLKTPQSHAFVLMNDQDDPCAMVYCNEGAGLSCGGKYLWVNCIYVVPEARHSGVAESFMNWIMRWARKRGATYFIALRHDGNEASQKLFARLGFAQRGTVMMES